MIASAETSLRHADPMMDWGYRTKKPPNPMG